MAKLIKALRPSSQAQCVARFLAMVVRNEMEDFHHEHLSDEQMKELNPIIRNAIYTGLHALRQCNTSRGAKAFVEFQTMLIPSYWEEPCLTADFVTVVKTKDGELGKSSRTSKPLMFRRARK